MASQGLLTPLDDVYKSAGFPYASPGQIFAEHAALSAFENDGQRDFDLGGLMHADYDAMEPVQWPVRAAGTERMFGDGHFFTPDRRARFVAITPPPPLRPSPGMFILNTGRVRDHWHTMTRTGKTARLSSHMAEPFAEIHPDDANRLGIHRASLVRLENQHGIALVRALITDRQQRGTVFVPIHWTDQFAAKSRIDVLVSSKRDPQSGQPALKMSEVSVEPAGARIYGFAVSRLRPNLADADYWAIAEAAGGIRTELAWLDPPADWDKWVRRAFDVAPDATLLSVRDARSGRQNFALFEAGRLVFAVFTSPDPVLVSRQWAAGLLTRVLENAHRSDVLAGRPGVDMPDSGAIICACFSVGINSIVDAVTKNGCHSVEAIGAALKAGTNCGSCRAEIRGIIDANRLAAAE